jgi:hypothetical protein
MNFDKLKYGNPCEKSLEKQDRIKYKLVLGLKFKISSSRLNYFEF